MILGKVWGRCLLTKGQTVTKKTEDRQTDRHTKVRIAYRVAPQLKIVSCSYFIILYVIGDYQKSYSYPYTSRFGGEMLITN